MKLFCRRYGEGPPLIILHGLYGSSDNWITIAKKISSHFTVYLPDLRNHGQSPHNPEHDYESMSNDIFELVLDYGFRSFFIAGHSMGGKTAISFALKWPEMIKGLVVIDISPFTDNISFSAAQKKHEHILKSILETDISKARTRKEVEDIFSVRIPSELERIAVMKNVHRGNNTSFTWKLNAGVLLKSLDIILEGINRDIIDNMTVTGFPVLFLKGEKSEYLNEDDYSDILRLFPAAEFRVIKNAGHWIHTDNPVAVTEALISLIY